MTAIAAGSSDLFSVVTTGKAPARLRALLALAPQADHYLAYSDDTPNQRNVWAARLDDAVMHAERPVLLVASGASCFAAAWWARLSPADYIARIAGALLFDPLGDRGHSAAAERFASPRIALPFPSIVVSGTDRGDPARVQALVTNWGSGHASYAEPGAVPGRGARWRVAQDALLRVTSHLVERRLRVADALGVRLVER
jgi:uncharacterized protein